MYTSRKLEPESPIFIKKRLVPPGILLGSDAKRLKSETAPSQDDTAVPPEREQGIHKVGPVSFQKGTPQNDDLFENIVRETTALLNEAGKLVIGPPVLCSDEMIFHWSSGTTAPNSSVSRACAGNTSGRDGGSPLPIKKDPKIERDLSPISVGSHSSFAKGDDIPMPPIRQSIDEDIAFSSPERVLLFKGLGERVNGKDLVRLLIENNFPCSTIREIVIFSFLERSASVEFIHKHLADAAYTILDGMNNPFWRKQYHGPLSVVRCSPLDTQNKPIIPVSEPSTSARRLASSTPFVQASDPTPAPTPALAAPMPVPLTMPEAFVISDEYEDVIPGLGCLSSVALVPEVGSHTTRDVNALYGSLAADYLKSDAEDGDDSEEEDPQDKPPIPQPIEIDVEMENAFALLQETTESVPIDPRGSRLASQPHSLDSEALPSSSRRKRQIKVHPLRSRSGSPMSLSSDQEDQGLEEDEQSSDSFHEEPSPRMKTGPRICSGSTVSTSSSALVPKVPYGRARRVLVPSSPGLPVATISMRADAQFIDPEKHYRKSLCSLPFKGSLRHVEDACVVDDTVVVGYNAGPCQISLLPINKAPKFIDLIRKPHIQTKKHGGPAARVGVISLAPVPGAAGTVKFLSGGTDRTIFLWATESHHLHNVTVERITTTSTAPYALAYRPRDKTILYSAGTSLSITNMTRRSAKPTSSKFSNTIHNIHMHPHDPNITVIEVKHLDHQIQMFDSRKGYNRPPCVQFGHRCQKSKQVESRYSRGSCSFNYFVRGYADGCIKIWDCRNTKNVIIHAQHQRKDPVIHTNWTTSGPVAFGGEVVTFLDRDGNILSTGEACSL